jgi:hypothetical protein
MQHDDHAGRPGEPVPPCQDAPAVRYRDPDVSYQPREESRGYTSRGYIGHFLPDREVSIHHLTRALQDVYGEPALHVDKMELVIDEAHWKAVCSDPWGGNIHSWSF